MKKLYSFLPALIFLVFLGVMALLLLFSPVRDYSENEKRYLAGRPEVTVSGILEGETQEQGNPLQIYLSRSDGKQDH